MADIDLRIDMDWQARAVLAALDGAFDSLDDDRDLRIRTYQIVNGRERHAALVMEKGLGGPCRLVSFGECRNTDGLVVWVSSLDRRPFNQPTVEHLSDDAYLGVATNGDFRREFDCGNVMAAVEAIIGAARKLLKGEG